MDCSLLFLGIGCDGLLDDLRLWVLLDVEVEPHLHGQAVRRAAGDLVLRYQFLAAFLEFLGHVAPWILAATAIADDGLRGRRWLP